ncbi:MAG: acyl transferase [Bacteroidetes bacterium]|nr:acyl transferase [Bacteroidota bacterium]
MQVNSRQLYEMIRNVGQTDFESVALQVFRHQAENNVLYAQFLDLLGVSPATIGSLREVPFLPIELFKKYRIVSGEWKAEMEFTSSGTTGSIPSRHFIRSAEWYRSQAVRGFNHQYGDLKDYCILALLPHYLDRQGSSLVQMVRDFMEVSGHPYNGFYLRDQEKLIEKLKACKEQEIPTLLIGVSFALWDLAEKHPLDLSGITVMETGGMKGQRRELIREELHQILKDAFNLDQVHSEYGMTELLSQAYAPFGGRFYPSPTMRTFVSDITDPLALVAPGQQGLLCIVDLANVDSCSFIATEDIGRQFEDGSFEVLGRLDRAAWRGCNLMIQSDSE